MTKFGKLPYILNKYVLVFLILLCNGILVCASSDNLAPNTSFGEDRGQLYREAQLLIPGPYPQAFKSRQSISLEQLKQRIKFVSDIVEKKKDVQTHLKIYLNLLNQAGLISNQVLNQSWNNRKAKLLVQLIQKITEVTEFKNILNKKDPEFQNALGILVLRIDEVEGHPLLMTEDEAFAYWTKRLNINELLSPLAVDQRAMAEQNSAISVRRDQVVVTHPQSEGKQSSQVFALVGTELVLVRDGAAGAMVIRSEPGFLTWRAEKRSSLNASYFVMRLLELSLLADDESLRQAVELIRYTQFDQSLFRLFQLEDIIQFYDVTKSIFEKMDDKDAASLFLEIARLETSSQDYEEVVAWLSNTLSSMNPENAAHMLEKLSFDPELNSSFSRMLVDQILQYGFWNNQLHLAWHILAAQYPDQIWDWDEFYRPDSSLTSAYKKANGIGDILRSLRQRLQGHRVFERASYEDLSRQLHAQLQAARDLNLEQKVKQLQHISDLVLLGQNGFAAYDLILKNQQADWDQIPFLFAAQDPEVLAIFLVEVGTVLMRSKDEEGYEGYAGLLGLLDPHCLGNEFVKKVIAYMLRDEKYRNLGSHKILQKVITTGSMPIHLQTSIGEIDLMRRVYDLVEIVSQDQAIKGVYNSYEFIQSSGVFLVKDLEGELREHAVKNIFLNLKNKLNSPSVKIDVTGEEELDREFPISDPEEINKLIHSIQSIGELQFGSHPDDFKDFPQKVLFRTTRNYYDGPYESVQILRGGGFQGAGVAGVPIEELKKYRMEIIQLLIQYACGDYAPGIREASLYALQKIDPEIVEFFLNKVFEDTVEKSVRVRLMEVYNSLASHLWHAWRSDQVLFYKHMADEFFYKMGWGTRQDDSKVLRDLLRDATRGRPEAYKSIVLCMIRTERNMLLKKSSLDYVEVSRAIKDLYEFAVSIDEQSGPKLCFDLFDLAARVDDVKFTYVRKIEVLRVYCHKLKDLIQVAHDNGLVRPIMAVLKINTTSQCIKSIEGLFESPSTGARSVKKPLAEITISEMLATMLATSSKGNGTLWVDILFQRREVFETSGINFKKMVEYASKISDKLDHHPELMAFFVEKLIMAVTAIYNAYHYIDDGDHINRYERTAIKVNEVLDLVFEKIFLYFLDNFSLENISEYKFDLKSRYETEVVIPTFNILIDISMSHRLSIYYPWKWGIISDQFFSLQKDVGKLMQFVRYLEEEFYYKSPYWGNNKYDIPRFLESFLYEMVNNPDRLLENALNKRFYGNIPEERERKMRSTYYPSMFLNSFLFEQWNNRDRGLRNALNMDDASMLLMSA